MDSLPFTKMHGLGNSYVYLDGFRTVFDSDKLPALARFLASADVGIGGDGMILITRSDQADLKMRIFNKDGSEAKNCGNGLRCVAAYAYKHRLIAEKNCSIETLGGIVKATIIRADAHETWVSINMGKPKLLRQEIPMRGEEQETVIGEAFSINRQALRLTAVSMGNPHAVFFCSKEERDLHRSLGPLIEQDERFPERVNVEFVTKESSNSFRCRVWERGSGATQACGTGACATAVAAVLNGYAEHDTDLMVHLEGGSLKIKWEKEGDVWMTGPAKIIAFGTVVGCPSFGMD